MNALAQPEPEPTAGPGAGASDGREATVGPFHTEQDLARKLAPWAGLAKRQRMVKYRLLAADLGVLFVAFVLGRLPAVIRNDMSLLHAMNVWWALGTRSGGEVLSSDAY